MLYIGNSQVSPIEVINNAPSEYVVTAINNSNFDRVEREKVWVEKVGSTYYIRDVLGITSYYFTGVCVDNINKNSSGRVVVIDGNLVNHYTANYNKNGGANPDDNAQIATLLNTQTSPNNYSSDFIYSDSYNIEAGTYNKVEINCKFMYHGTNSTSTSCGFIGIPNMYSNTDIYSPKLGDIRGLHVVGLSNGNIVVKMENDDESPIFTIAKITDIQEDKWYYVRAVLTTSGGTVDFSTNGSDWQTKIMDDYYSISNNFPITRFSAGIGYNIICSLESVTIDLNPIWTNINIKNDDTIIGSWKAYEYKHE